MAKAGINCGLRTERLHLRPLTKADAARVSEILSHPQVGPMISRIPMPYPAEDARAWLATHAAERNAGTAFRFGVVKECSVIGCVDIANIHDDVGELGYWFDPGYRKMGFAYEAAKAVLEFAFNTLGLEELTASHAFDNGPSARLLARLGFEPFGRHESWSESRQMNIVQISNRLKLSEWMNFR